MSKAKPKKSVNKPPTSFLGCLRHFLTPEVFRQVHQVAGAPERSDTRWLLHPLLSVLLLSCWVASDSSEERFAAARAFYVRSVAPKRRRPGRTLLGFQGALARLPSLVLRAFASALRARLCTLFSPVWRVQGFVPLGCDGTRLACPRSEELEARLSQDKTSKTPPQVWVTAIVHLRLGLLWDWVIGKPDASERQHLLEMAPRLPDDALVVTDAGYQGYLIASTLDKAGVKFLMRVSSQTLLYLTGEVPASGWVDGVVYWWTGEARDKEQAPLQLRLMRVRNKGCKTDVWMVSNVSDQEKLSLDTAGRFYRMRWESEGFFRTYKRTLKKVKLTSRTVRMVHREVMGSLLAVQLLLAQGAWALAVVGRTRSAQSSPSGVLREIRAEVQGEKRRGSYLDRLRRVKRDQRVRKISKVRRPWPGRKPHKPPKAPELRTLPDELKPLFAQYFDHEGTRQC